MNESEREQFAPFIHHKRTRRQIVEAIDNISMASYTGNVVITGEEGTETMALAKLLVKEVQLSDNNFSGKVAKISGSTMNKKDIGATLSKLSGGALIIEGAADMKKAATEQLLKELRIAQQEQEIKKLSDFVLKAKQASRTNHNLKRMGQDREVKLAKAIAALEKRDKLYKHVKMRLEPKRESAKIPLEVKNLSFNYADRPKLYDKLSFNLVGNERFLIVGENGVGKSTLLKLIMGVLHPTGGEVVFNPKTDTAYYAQELELLDENKTVLENVESASYTDLQLRNVLGNFLFNGDAVFKRVGLLSPGGESAHCALQVVDNKGKLANSRRADQPPRPRHASGNRREFPRLYGHDFGSKS